MSPRLPLCVLALAAACSSNGAGGPSTLVRVDVEPDGPHCAGGGAAIHTGLDRDGDRFLDDDEITSTQYVCNGASAVQCGGGTIAKGTVAIRATADLAQLAGVSCIDGDLLVAGVDADALDELADLHAVTGDVVIAGNPALTSLDGLRNLEEVGDTYLIQGNDRLADLSALGGVHRAAQISIVGNDALTDLAGLERLVDLRSVLTIASNASLTSLAGLDHLVTASRTIMIRSNRSLTSLAALDHLRTAVLIEISGNAALPRVAPAALEKVDGRVLINNNAALTAVELPALTTVGDYMQLSGNGALTSVSAPALLTIAGLLVASSTRLASLSAPRLVFATTNVELGTVPQLSAVDLTGLGSIGGSLLITSAPALRDLRGLARLRTIGNELKVSGAGSLASFAGLDALEAISGDLTITNNAQLTSFAGLGALAEIGEDLTVTGNPLLPRPLAQAFASQVTVRGTVTIN